MRLVTVAAALATLALGIARPSRACAEPAPAAAHYCNLGFFTAATAARHLELAGKLGAAVKEVRDLSDGYEFRFPGSFREAGEWVDGVRGCCPTLSYDLHFDRQSGDAWVRVTGSDGARKFIAEEFRHLFVKAAAAR